MSGKNMQVVKNIEKMSEGKFVLVRNISWSETKVSLCIDTTAKFYVVAKFVGNKFSVLIDRLPSERKPWHSEHRSMALFMAVALVITPIPK
ncbi:MAG: hypothetical protein COB49_10775 [Alphaproteobacteria bacterium]|nr:MAG: hypothetical protein COB49_10775 [Alphaproteobacteria bacterium]